MPPEPLSLAIVNARVWTNDARRPWADGVAVRGDRIAAVGSSAEIRKMSVASTRVIDGKGRMLVPGSAGSITRGAIADFRLVEPDTPGTAPDTIGDARVMMTVAAGRVVFER